MVLKHFSNSNIRIISGYKLEQYVEFCQSHNLNRRIKFKTACHHILLRSMFPEFQDLKAHPGNKTLLYHKDHLKAHMILAEAVDDIRALLSVKYIYDVGSSFNNIKECDVDYDKYQGVCEELLQKRKIKMTGENNPTYGLTGELSYVYGDKNGMYGTHRSGEDNPFYGKTHSEETKIKMRKPRKKHKCPHCGKVGGGGNMKRYHFENCPHIVSTDGVSTLSY